MIRELEHYLRDIVDPMGKAQQFVKTLSYEEFREDDKTVFAVVTALELVGEATKNIPNGIRKDHPEIPWKDMAGMRDVLIHDYFGTDVETVWLTVTDKIPQVKPMVAKILEKL